VEQANVVIIGGGIVGCAIAQALSFRWSDVFVLEALPKIGMAASSRNSGVIHSGLYYPLDSLKARLCVRGNDLTYEFCMAHHVPHHKTGKLVIATSPAESQELVALMMNGEANGVEGMRIINRAAILAREPHVNGFEAIEVPSTGIVGSEELTKAYARIAKDRGANIVTNASVERLEPTHDGIRVVSAVGEIETRCLVNSAGLFADEVAAMIGSPMAANKIYPVRGEYCELVRSKRDLVRGLVYPLPHPEGVSLGVHFTKTVWGSVLLGPTALYLDDKNNYERGRQSIEQFAIAAKPLLPEIEPSDLILAYSGIRAKLTPPVNHGEKRVADFIIQPDPKFPRVVQLIGIESPGLTSAPAIAEHVSVLVTEILA
jgi:glycerol-3-phosphate dehydrogenase